MHYCHLGHLQENSGSGGKKIENSHLHSHNIYLTVMDNHLY